MSPTGGIFYKTLDGWRAIAVLGVVITHACHRIFSDGSPWESQLWFSVTRYGSYGVDIFFGISGFLICSRLLEEERRNGSISLKKFYLRRLFRILPPYYLYLAIVMALSVMSIVEIGFSELISCILFYRNYLPKDLALGEYTGHLWSLSVEEHFYLLLPFILACLNRRSSLWFITAFALLVGLWRVIEFRLNLIPSILPGVGFYDRSDIAMDGLLWGAVLAHVVRQPNINTWLEKKLTPGVWLTLVATCIAIVVTAIPLAHVWKSMLIPLIIYGTIVHPDRIFGRFLDSKTMVWIGQRSYGIYVWQSLFLVSADVIDPPMGVFQLFPLNLLPVFVIAALSYEYFEKPIMAIGRRKASSLGPNQPK